MFVLMSKMKYDNYLKRYEESVPKLTEKQISDNMNVGYEWERSGHGERLVQRRPIHIRKPFCEWLSDELKISVNENNLIVKV